MFGCGQFRTFRPGFGFGQRYHVDHHGQPTLKQLRLSVLNEMHTNSYSGPRLERFCVDYRKLNGVIRTDSHPDPIPHVQDTLDCLHGTSYFSCLDLRSGYWQAKLMTNLRQKPLLPPITVYSNSVRCPSASLTLLLHFNVLCTLFFAVSSMISA